MSDFVDDFPDEAILDALGDTVTYTGEAWTGTFKAIVEFDVEQVGDEGYTSDSRTEIEVFKDFLQLKPKRGHEIIHKNINYTVDSVASDDGAYVTLRMKK